MTREDLLRGSNPKTGTENVNNNSSCHAEEQQQQERNVLMHCGQSYSVSQNQIVHLPGPESSNSQTQSTSCVSASCKHSRQNQGQKRKGLVLNLTNQFEAASSKPSSPSSDGEGGKPQSVLENGCCAHEDSTDTEQQDNTGKPL